MSLFESYERFIQRARSSTLNSRATAATARRSTQDADAHGVAHRRDVRRISRAVRRASDVAIPNYAAQGGEAPRGDLRGPADDCDRRATSLPGLARAPRHLRGSAREQPGSAAPATRSGLRQRTRSKIIDRMLMRQARPIVRTSTEKSPGQGRSRSVRSATALERSAARASWAQLRSTRSMR